MRTEDYVSAGGTQKLATASSSKLITKLTRKALGNKAAKSQQQQQQQQQYLTPVKQMATRCPIHQHFTCNFFVQKFFAQLLSSCSWAL